MIGYQMSKPCKGILYGVLAQVFFIGKVDSQQFVAENHVYLESIKSVQFGLPELHISHPMVELGRERLTLEFDELADQTRYLRYRIQHCNRDWTPSDLDEFEYLEGFNNEELRSNGFSVNTLTPYVHYSLRLPNEDVRWKLSGNYLLHIYDEDTEEPILTRRFVVFEDLTKITIYLRRASDVSLIQTHHEIDFLVKHDKITFDNPLQNVRAVVMQNGRWDTAIKDVPPFRINPQQLSFEYQNQLVFPAGKEFRSVDIRSLTAPSLQVADIEVFDDVYEMRLKKDSPRTYQDYHSHIDLNGHFIIQSYDRPNADTEADYAYVVFSLAMSQPLFDHYVYVVGGFSDWEVDPRYMLEYQDRQSAYQGEALLKQGVYDYIYATVAKDGGAPDFNALEGSWHETENYYTVLLYHRPFGARYDRVIGAKTLDVR